MLEYELKINPEFEEIIPPISPDEFTQLEDNIVAEGELLMPIIIWKGFIIDGHSRYKILQKHPEIECKIIEKHFEDKYEAIAWICKNQIGGRNLSERYIKYLRGKQYEAEKKSCKFHGNQYTLAKESGLGYFNPDHNIHGTRTALAEKNGVSESKIRYSQEFSRGLDAAEEVLPGIRKEVLNGTINPTDQAIKGIARLPMEKRKDAAERLRTLTDRRSLPRDKIKEQSADRIASDTEADTVSCVNEEDIINSIGAAVGDLIDLCNNYFTRFPKLLSDERYQRKTMETLNEFRIYISKIERKNTYESN